MPADLYQVIRPKQLGKLPASLRWPGCIDWVMAGRLRQRFATRPINRFARIQVAPGNRGMRAFS
jgi:hypothetical protein